MSQGVIHPQGHDSNPTGAAEWPSVPGYDLLRELGRGHTGVVYQARQLLQGRMVALKRVSDDTVAAAHGLHAFCDGARAASRLQHPNIVPIHEVGDAAGEPYLASEFVEGESLQQRLARTLPAPVAAARLVETLARAVHHGHERGVVHGHLSPANVMLAARDTPRITDYGLGRFVPGPHPFSGDPAYTAPEQAGSPPQELAPSADVYGLGAILYALLTGRPPLLAGSTQETLRLVRSRTPVAPGRLHPGLPSDLEAICLKCLSKRPDQRYSTALDLAEDLRHFQEGRSVQNRPARLASRARRWCRENPAALAACVGLVAVLGVAAYGHWSAAQDRRQIEARQHQAEQGEQDALGVRDQEAGARALAQRQALQAELTGKNAVLDRDEARRQLEEQTKARQAAEREYQGESRARIGAEERARDAQEAQRQAVSQRSEVARRLLGMHVAAGTRAVADGDLTGSLPWFTQALRLAAAERLSEETHRMRLAVILSQCPRPVRVWYLDKKPDLVRLSPDGQKVLTAGPGGDVLWDVRTGRAGDPLKHTALVTDAVFSPDGKRLLTADAEANVHLWDVDAGKELLAPLQQTGPVVGMAFRPDGKQILTVSYKSPRDLTEAEARLWDAASGEAGETPLGSQVAPLPAEFSPDGKRVLTVCLDRCARVWDCATGNQVGASLEHPAAVRRASFRSDGRHVVTASADGTARVWDAATGKPATRPLNHGAPVVEASFNAGGRYVLTAGEDRVVRVWESATGAPVGHAVRHDEPLTRVLFSPDGRHGLSADEGGVVRLWEVATGDAIAPPLRQGSGVKSAAFDPIGRQVLTFDGAAIRLWDLTIGEPLLPPATGDTRGLVFSADGKWAARVTGRKVQTQDMATGKPVGPPLEHDRDVAAVTLGPTGRHLLCVCHDGDDSEVRIWDAESGKQIGKALDHVRPVIQTFFSPDGKQVLTVCKDKKARVWDAATGEPIGQPMDHQKDLERGLFSPDGKNVLTIDIDSTVRVWESATGQSVGRGSFGHKLGVNHLAFSPDGKRVATAGADGFARVWELATSAPVGETMRHGAAVVQTVFSADGKRVATASADRTARVWDAATGEPVTPPLRHLTAVALAAFSADGRWVLTATGDRLRLWDAATGEPLGPPLPHGHEGQAITSALLDRGGRLLTTAGTSGDPAGRCERALRPDDRPAPLLEQLAEVLASQRADGGGAVAPYDAKEFAAAWQALREKAAAEFSPNEDRILAWERRGAGECEARGLWHGAAAHLGRLIEAARTPGDLYARRARAHAELHQWQQARADYAKALEGDAGRWELWAGKGAAAAALGHWDEAVADYTKAIERKDGDADLWLRRGQADAERGKWDRAAADLGKAITLGRNDAELRYQHAVALLAGGDRDGYRRACARLVRPGGREDESAQRLLARTCTLAADAVADLGPLLRQAEKAVESNPRSAADLVRLGTLLYRSGQYEPAVKRLEEAGRLNSEEAAPRDWLFLAMANQRLGRAGEARKWLEKAAQWLDKEAADRGKEGAARGQNPWAEWQEYQLLRREAEALVGKT